MTTALYDVHAAVLAHLRAALDPVLVHDGRVVDPALDGRGRIQPYLILWVAPGTDPQPSVAGAQAPRAGAEHRLHVTAAGGTPDRCLWAVDRATTLLSDAHLALGDGDAAVDVTVQWLPGYTPPPAQEDRDANPARWFVPLIFNATAV